MTDENGRPGASWDGVRAVTVGALLAIAAGLVLDAAPSLTADQRLVAAGISTLLAALLGLSGYRGRR